MPDEVVMTVSDGDGFGTDTVESCEQPYATLLFSSEVLVEAVADGPGSPTRSG